MKAAELLVKCLENQRVEYIFGIPGEENIDVMDALLDSPIKFVTTHRERSTPQDTVRGADLERFRIRPHHLAPVAPLRQAEPHRVQESGLRQVRRELWRQGYRVDRAEDLEPTLRKAIKDDTVVVIDCPVDYSQNMLLTARLKEMTSPL